MATTEEIVQWIVKNVFDGVVPADEGNTDALVYNLIHLVIGDGKFYLYLPEQDAEIKAIYQKYGREYYD